MPRDRGGFLLLVICVALRDWRRVARVVAPMALTTAAIVAVLRALGLPLDLFHLMSLVLAAGLGVDYALFFERTGDDRDERLRTLHARTRLLRVDAHGIRAAFVFLDSGIALDRHHGDARRCAEFPVWRSPCRASLRGPRERGIDIRALVPHAGTMCLLEEVVAWNADGATVTTRSHTAPAIRCVAASTCRDLPLRIRRPGDGGTRRAGGPGIGTALAPGLLVSLREVELVVAASNRCRANCASRSSGSSGQSAGFSIAFA